jgi:hypothetical protein
VIAGDAVTGVFSNSSFNGAAVTLVTVNKT